MEDDPNQYWNGSLPIEEFQEGGNNLPAGISDFCVGNDEEEY
jgi:hypothetical protein